MRKYVLVGLVVGSLSFASTAISESSNGKSSKNSEMQSATQAKNQAQGKINAETSASAKKAKGSMNAQSDTQEEMKGRLSQMSTEDTLGADEAIDNGSKKVFGTNRQLNLRGSADLRGKSNR